MSAASVLTIGTWKGCPIKEKPYVDVQRIVCPIDFSDASRHALEHAAASATWDRAHLTVVQPTHEWRWIVVSAWMLSGASAVAQWNGVVAGLLILALSLPRGHIREQYGSWQSWIV